MSNNRIDPEAVKRAFELIRRDDVRKAQNRKRKLLSVEIDPETYIAKEILYLEDLVHRLAHDMRAMRIMLEDEKEKRQKIWKLLENEKNKGKDN